MFLEEVIEKEVSRSKKSLDSNPFGKTLRSFNNTNKYAYQGSEKEKELSDNNYYTHYRELNTEVARWFSVDPKNNFAFSPYSSMNCNPVMNTDVFGDSIRKDDSFLKNIGAMTAYTKFLGTEAGQNFLKDYGEGGKYEHIAVVLTIGKTSDSRGSAETGLEIVSKDGKAENINFFQGNTIVPDGQALAKNEMNNGSYLRFTMKFNWGGEASESSKGVYLANNIETLVHEPQHIKITLMTLRQSSTIMGSILQHQEMNRFNGEYYRERYYEYLNNVNMWYSDYKGNLGTSKEIKTYHEYIKNAVLAQD